MAHISMMGGSDLVTGTALWIIAVGFAIVVGARGLGERGMRIFFI